MDECTRVKAEFVLILMQFNKKTFCLWNIYLDKIFKKRSIQDLQHRFSSSSSDILRPALYSHGPSQYSILLMRWEKIWLYCWKSPCVALSPHSENIGLLLVNITHLHIFAVLPARLSICKISPLNWAANMLLMQWIQEQMENWGKETCGYSFCFSDLIENEPAGSLPCLWWE